MATGDSTLEVSYAKNACVHVIFFRGGYSTKYPTHVRTDVCQESYFRASLETQNNATYRIFSSVSDFVSEKTEIR